MLVLVRGLPGSGKSTIAREYSRAGFLHLEADQFLFTSTGEYQWTPTRLTLAHQRCQEEARLALLGRKSVVVSNTFVRSWEVEPYLSFARETGAQVVIVKAQGRFGSIHDVPEHVIRRMTSIWEDIPGEMPSEAAPPPPQVKGICQMALL